MAVKFRLGLNIYDKTGKCPSCGKESDELGDHGMVCGTGGERISRQSSTTLSKTDTRLNSCTPRSWQDRAPHYYNESSQIFLQKFLPSLYSSFSEKGNVHKSSTLAVAREEVADLRGGIWLRLCAASPLIIHFSHLPVY